MGINFRIAPALQPSKTPLSCLDFVASVEPLFIPSTSQQTMRHRRRPSLYFFVVLIISLEGTSLSSHPFPPSSKSGVKISHQIGRFPGNEEMAGLCFGSTVRHWLFVWVLGAQQIFYSRPRLCLGWINTVITSAASKNPAINHVFCVNTTLPFCAFKAESFHAVLIRAGRALTPARPGRPSCSWEACGQTSQCRAIAENIECQSLLLVYV